MTTMLNDVSFENWNDLQATENESTRLDQCNKTFVDIFVLALKNESNEIVTVDETDSQL